MKGWINTQMSHSTGPSDWRTSPHRTRMSCGEHETWDSPINLVDHFQNGRCRWQNPVIRQGPRWTWKGIPWWVMGRGPSVHSGLCWLTPHPRLFSWCTLLRDPADPGGLSTTPHLRCSSTRLNYRDSSFKLDRHLSLEEYLGELWSRSTIYLYRKNNPGNDGPIDDYIKKWVLFLPCLTLKRKAVRTSIPQGAMSLAP